MPLLITLHNKGDSTIVVDRDPVTNVEFAAKRGVDSSWIWRSIPDGVIGGRGSEDTMPPGAIRSFRGVWLQRDDSGRAVPPGTYCVYGFLMQEPSSIGTVQSATVTIER